MLSNSSGFWYNEKMSRCLTTLHWLYNKPTASIMGRKIKSKSNGTSLIYSKFQFFPLKRQNLNRKYNPSSYYSYIVNHETPSSFILLFHRKRVKYWVTSSSLEIKGSNSYCSTHLTIFLSNYYTVLWASVSSSIW